ncbi:MAG: succinylglutamate desuccinylase/aspartoacylase family protein [Acidobacteria bacterium]|nr:succinylglutamate desuccinylase/aspartoacylase family protein [Acidobacteriota bacterium]
MILNINIDNFRFEDFSETGKHRAFLELDPAGAEGSIGLPLMIANGAMPGKTLVVFAAVHGDELEGVQAIQDVFSGLNTDEMSGRLIAVPVANLPAFRAVQRVSPIDGLNLARTFPGKKDGTITEQIAHHLGKLIIPQGDFFLDLHSAPGSLMPRMVGYDASGSEAGRISKEAALKMGMPVVWGHPDLGPGRSLCAAIERGIPWLYVESPSGRRVSADELPYYIDVLLNLLGYLKIIGREPSDKEPELHLIGSGDVDRTQSVDTAGFFVQKVKLLDHVKSGTLVGEVRDLFGEVIEEVRTEQAGYVAVLRSDPLVRPGDPVCLVAEAYREPDAAGV